MIVARRLFRFRSVCLRLGFLLLPLIFTLSLGAAAARGQGAEAVEVLTPPPSGATVIARKPETHLILRQFWRGGPVQVQVEKSGAKLDPVLVDEHKEHNYLHFRLPLEPGLNRFTLVPGGKRIELTYRRLQGNLNPGFLGKDVVLFHQDDRLPKSCEGCHDLQKTTTIDRVGLKKQVSCTACHKNITEEKTWLHSTTVNQQCLTCHQQSVIPWRIGFPDSKVQEICLTCHNGKKDWISRKFIHGPLALGGSCTLCHSPHGENYRYQLWAEGSVAICIECHSDKQNLVSEKGRLPYVHGIIKGEGCVACHDPHATDLPFMLHKPINQLCVDCHTRLAGITRGHPVGGHPVAGPKERRRPGRELTCVSCHDPHGSPNRYFLIRESRGSNVCIACHR